MSRLRVVTRGVIVAATGATVAMGIVVSHDHPGASAVGTKAASLHVEQRECVV